MVSALNLNTQDSQFDDMRNQANESIFINRELSWLEFNERVLQQAYDSSLPLLERAKFLAITSSNLDEFMMVRAGSLKLQYERNPFLRDPAGLTVEEQLRDVSQACKKHVERQCFLYNSDLETALAQSGIRRLDIAACGHSELRAVEQKLDEIEAILSPQTISHSNHFPLLQGLSLHLCVRLKQKQDLDCETNPSLESVDESVDDFSIIPLGKSLSRVIPLPSDTGHTYLLLEDLITTYISRFFPGREVLECSVFRITRNADIELREDSAPDLMVGMEEVLESRNRSRVIRLEYQQGTSERTLDFLTQKMEIEDRDLYSIQGPLDLTHLFTVYGLRGFDSLRDTPWPAQKTPNLDPTKSMFSNISERDFLLSHPYESFDPIVRMIEEAASDDRVLAIKQVLYRTSRQSPIVAALKKAAQNGKYVSVVVELKARFDEARNIEWAREMERTGVQVIYGIRGLKTHAKVCIIVRKESHGITRYMHFGTGNYNEATANLYGDISLLTCNEELGSEATSFFNAIAGASQLTHLQQIAAAPDSLRPRLLGLIEQERIRCGQGQKGEIVAKLNALVDPKIIEALYAASQAGVRVKLNIRGVCCLRPGVKGLSENITVVSIVDRFLEHARVLYFRQGGNPKIFISSADWMPRNLDRRIELLVPILDPLCAEKLGHTLRCYFKDQSNAWSMDSNGKYLSPERTARSYRVQHQLYETAKAAAVAERNLNQGQFQPHLPKAEH